MYIRLARENPFISGKAPRRSGRQPFDDLGTPTLFGLPGQNVPTDLPVEQDQLVIYRQRRALLGGMDASFQV